MLRFTGSSRSHLFITPQNVHSVKHYTMYYESEVVHCTFQYGKLGNPQPSAMTHKLKVLHCEYVAGVDVVFFTVVFGLCPVIDVDK